MFSQVQYRSTSCTARGCEHGAARSQCHGRCRTLPCCKQSGTTYDIDTENNQIETGEAADRWREAATHRGILSTYERVRLGPVVAVIVEEGILLNLLAYLAALPPVMYGSRTHASRRPVT